MLSAKSDYAIYAPSISAEFAKIGQSKHLKRNFAFNETDLNFLDPASGLFHYPYALYSAGQAAKTDAAARQMNIVSCRDRNRTTIIGDSGGFQIQQGTIKFQGTPTTSRILQWLEGNTDFAMTLDFPTGGIAAGTVAPHTARLLNEGYDLKALCKTNGLSLDYNACLKQSLINLDYFKAHRQPSMTNFLNVIQGRNEKESKVWYEAVKHYELEGWAFAGTHQAAFSMILNRLVDMFVDGFLQKAKWIHVLGISTLGTAFLFTTILRCVRSINPEIAISFDTSSPFTIAANFEFCPSFRLDKYGYQIKSASMPEIGNIADTRTLNQLCRDLTVPISIQRSGMRVAREVVPFAAETAIGERVTVAEICVGSNGSSDLDNDSVWLLMNHNVQTYVQAFQELNESYDLNRLHDNLPVQVYRAKICIELILKAAFNGNFHDARSLIAKCATYLDEFAEERR